jgi:pyruvate/2-oxoglutarate dehydrogenase complex dihydrolipoamide acyltransferase (E2) component
VVGEYVGQPAGDAAQAVRRAGLCPGLDRSFGCEAELIGLVVAQEPASGSDLARNGMVTLYVAAPGAGPMDEPAAIEAVDEAPAAVTVTAVLAEIEPPDAANRPRRTRRRKPGLARQATGVFDPPPAPIPLEREPAEEVPLAPECGSPDGELGEGRLGEQSDAELSHDDFVVHLDDVLGGRTGGPPAWRRVYPRRRTFAALTRVGGIRAWLGEHSLLAKAVGAALAVWILVGLASALDSQHAGTPTASLASPSHRPARTRTTQARPPVSAPSAASARPTARSPQVRRAGRHSEAPHLDRQRAPVIGAAAHPERMAVQAPAAAPPAPPDHASAPAAPPAQQTQGGLFSP